MTYAIDTAPTAESSYARTLIARGCPRPLAMHAARVLARSASPEDLSGAEEALIAQAYAQLR